VITCRGILLGVRHVSDRSCGENQNPHLSSITLSLKLCSLSVKVGKYGIAGQARDGNIMWRMRFECWLLKSTNAHSEYLIRIGFTRQHLLHDRCWMLHCKYSTVQYCIIQFSAVLHCTVLCYAVLRCAGLYCTVLYCTVLHCTVLYSTVLYCNVLYYTVQYCTVLYSTVLYFTIL